MTSNPSPPSEPSVSGRPAPRVEVVHEDYCDYPMCNCAKVRQLPPPSGSRERLLADVDGEPEVSLLGGGDQLGSLGAGDADGDRLARVDSGGSSGAALRGLGHAVRIGDTETLDNPGLSCHGNCMTTAAVLLIQTPQGDTVALTFPSIAAARDWEDEHEMELPGTVVGAVRVATKREALRG